MQPESSEFDRVRAHVMGSLAQLDKSSARKTAEAFADARPLSEEALSLAGDVLATGGLFAEALDRYNQALRINSACIPALLGKATCYINLDRPDLVDALAKDIPEGTGIWGAEEVLIDVVFRHEGAQKALERIRRLEGITAGDLHAQVLLTSLYAKVGEYEDALRVARRIEASTLQPLRLLSWQTPTPGRAMQVRHLS